MTVRGIFELISINDEVKIVGINGVKIYSGKFWNCPDSVRNLEVVDSNPVLKDVEKRSTTITVKEVF